MEEWTSDNRSIKFTSIEWVVPGRTQRKRETLLIKLGGRDGRKRGNNNIWRMDMFRNANRNLGMPTKKSVQVCKDAKQDLIWNANVDYSFA